MYSAIIIIIVIIIIIIISVNLKLENYCKKISWTMMIRRGLWNLHCLYPQYRTQGLFFYLSISTKYLYLRTAVLIYT